MKQKILLAEPSDLLRKVLTERLVIENYQVEAVADGLQAQEAIANGFYDVIIAESFMPYANGNELIRQAVKFGTPIIIISDADLEETILEAFELGASDFIDKPFSPNEVVARVKNIFRHQFFR